MKKKSSKPTGKVVSEHDLRAERVIRFIETYCLTPEGMNVGKPIVLDEFQRSFIRAVYGNPVGTRRAILSMARKNGKTSLIASILLAHICGPEAVLNSQIVSGALSRDQASLVFGLASKMISLSPKLSSLCRIIPSAKKIVGLVRNVEYKALAAEGSTAMGLSPVLAILDEIGQIKGPTSDFVEAITTSQGAYNNPLLIAISTQASSDADLLSLWIDEAVRSNDKRIVCHLYAADADCDLMDKSQWAKANPALGSFRSLNDLDTQLSQAKSLPALESSARNLLLNQRVAMDRLFLSASVWKKNASHPDMEVFQSRPVSIGLDLSARNDLTAAVVAARDDQGFVHVLPLVFCPTAGVEQRARRDKAPYDVWIRSGQMIPIGGETMDYDQIAEYMANWVVDNGLSINTIEFDRWRMDLFKKSALKVGFASEAQWNPVGQGFKDYSPRCEALMTLMLEGRIRHGGHPLLTLAASNAIAVKDPAGSIKLDKSKSTQRIDPLVAMAMAVYPVSDGATDAGGDLTWWVA